LILLHTIRNTRYITFQPTSQETKDSTPRGTIRSQLSILHKVNPYNQSTRKPEDSTSRGTARSQVSSISAQNLDFVAKRKAVQKELLLLTIKHQETELHLTFISHTQW
jgi:hypothetical protein